MCTKPSPFPGNVSTGSDKDKCKRYLISAVTEVTLALRFLVGTWKDLIRVQQEQGPEVRQDMEAVLRSQIVGSFVDKDMWQLVQLVLNQIIGILLHRLKARKYKLRMRSILGASPNNASSLCDWVKVRDDKVEHLKATAFVVASLADVIGVLGCKIKDPRVALMKFDSEKEAIQLLEKFRECLQ